MNIFLFLLLQSIFQIQQDELLDFSSNNIFLRYTGKYCNDFKIVNSRLDVCDIYQKILFDSFSLNEKVNTDEFQRFVLSLIIWDNLNLNFSPELLELFKEMDGIAIWRFSAFFELENLNMTAERLKEFFCHIGYQCADIRLATSPESTDGKSKNEILDSVFQYFRQCLRMDYKVVQHQVEQRDDEQSTTYREPGNSSISKRDGILASLLAWLLVSLLGLIGFVMIPLKKYKRLNTFVIQMLIALGFGTLAGDAVYHLIPHSIIPHTHGDEHDHHHHHGPGEHHHDFIQLGKLTVLIFGIVFFYLIEVFIKTCPFTRGKGCSCHNEQEGQPHQHNNSHVEDQQHYIAYGSPRGPPRAEQHKQCNENGKNDSVTLINTNGSLEPFVTQHSIFNSAVIVLLLGDMFHHILDGVAIGAAFTSPWPGGFQSGLATSIAIACHELPHKISDTIFLMSKGYSAVKSTIVVFASSSVSLIGVIIGCAASSKFDSAVEWVSMFTAGMFLYIALVLMMSQMINGFVIKEGPVWLYLFPHFVGTILGLGIMVLIARYEDEIAF